MKIESKNVIKDKLIKKIDMAILTEEDSLPIYAKHINNTLFWSGLNDEVQIKIKDTLNKLKKESQNHKVFLTQIKRIVSTGY